MTGLADRSSTDQRRPVVALLTANTVSQIGNTFSALAIPWFVLATTGSAGLTGLTVAVGTLPVIIVGIFGGAIVDRLGYRTSSVVSDIASGVTTLLIPLLYLTVGLAFWQLLTLVFLGAFLDGPGQTARLAIFPDLVQRTTLSLDRANALYSTTRRVAGLLGPPLAGVLIAVIGPANLLWVNAATFAVSAGIVGLLLPGAGRAVATAGDGVRGLRGYLGEVREGFRFLYSRSVLFWMITAFSLGGLIAEPLYAVILPVYANEIYGSALPLGMIFSALGAGSLVGNLVYAAVAPRLSRSALLFGGFAIRALCFTVLLGVPPWWVIAAAIFVSASTFEPINPMSMSVMQEQVPAGMRGRVFGAVSALGASTLPVGVLIYGALMSELGLETTLAIFVALNVALPMGMLLLPSLRDIPRPDEITAIDLQPQRTVS